MNYLPEKIFARGEQNRWNGVSPCFATQQGAEIMGEDMIDFIIDIVGKRIEMDGKSLKDFDREDMVTLYKSWSQKGNKF